MSIVTVTTTTVVVITTTTLGVVAALGAGGTCALIIALIAKELLSSVEGQKPSLKEAIKTLEGSLEIAIMPE
ncbi:hypothetical protein CW713_02895 [Methanophagales archaeon]|nr:MAG: hypothetical protein CW713_02895 [Methanophagales archaeon]